jgi:hypothetical protein
MRGLDNFIAIDINKESVSLRQLLRFAKWNSESRFIRNAVDAMNAVSPAIHGPCIPDRVTDIIAYLLSDQGQRLTGQVLRVGDPGLRP